MEPTTINALLDLFRENAAILQDKIVQTNKTIEDLQKKVLSLQNERYDAMNNELVLVKASSIQGYHSYYVYKGDKASIKEKIADVDVLQSISYGSIDIWDIYATSHKDRFEQIDNGYVSSTKYDHHDIISDLLVLQKQIYGQVIH